jgi:hypothetical protein
VTAAYVAFGVGLVVPTGWLALADCRDAARPAPEARGQAALVVGWDLLVVAVLAGIVLGFGAPEEVGWGLAAGIGVCAVGRWLTGRIGAPRPAFALTEPAAVGRIRRGPRARALERIGAERDRWLSRYAGEAAALLADLPPAVLERAAVDQVRARSFEAVLRGRAGSAGLPVVLAQIRQLLADEQEPYARRVEALVQLLLDTDGEPAVRALCAAAAPEPDRLSTAPPTVPAPGDPGEPIVRTRRMGRIRPGVPPEPPGQTGSAAPPPDPAESARPDPAESARPDPVESARADPAESAVPLSGLGSPAAD